MKFIKGIVVYLLLIIVLAVVATSVRAQTLGDVTDQNIRQLTYNILIQVKNLCDTYGYVDLPRPEKDLQRDFSAGGGKKPVLLVRYYCLTGTKEI